jgi:hypothetical protein
MHFCVEKSSLEGFCSFDIKFFNFSVFGVLIVCLDPNLQHGKELNKLKIFLTVFDDFYCFLQGKFYCLERKDKIFIKTVTVILL